MASLVAAAGVRAGRFPGRFPASGLAPCRCALVVRDQSELDVEPTEETSAPTTSSSSPSPTPAAAPTTPTPKPTAKAASAGLWDALAFSRPAPEWINGRLALVGFVSALAVAGRQRVRARVLSVASLVPLLQGESAEGRSGGFMSADAELWNGRFAMLDLVALAFTENLTDTPFINA